MIRLSFLRFVSVLFLIVPFSTHCFAQAAKAEACISDLMAQSAVVGLSVAVVKNNKVVYNHSFGLKNVESGTPLTNDCIFRIASISKSFSATSIMQLVADRKLSLDDDIGDLVGFRIHNPRYPDKVITLRMVLSHRSGINDSQGYFTLDAINPDKNPEWAKCYNDYEPGNGYMYCNLNYNMVGAIIEKKSGERFDQYVKHNILDPLKLYGGYCIDSLDSTKFASIYEFDRETKQFNHMPAAYAPRREEIAKYEMGYSTPVFSPTGGMKISAGDLAEYMIMHMKLGKHKNKRIISRKHARVMQAPFAGKEGYGLAIATSEKLIPGKLLKGHTGSAYGLYSAMFFHPAEKWGIVVISNGCDPAYADGFNTVIRNTVQCLYENIIR